MTRHQTRGIPSRTPLACAALDVFHYLSPGLCNVAAAQRRASCAHSANAAHMASRPAFWRRTRSESKFGFDKMWRTSSPTQTDAVSRKVTTTIVSEHFWPSSIDKESDKAVCILRSFCSGYSRNHSLWA